MQGECGMGTNHGHVLRLAVRVAEHCDGADAKTASRPHDATRDLAAVRDQNLVKET